MFRNIKEAAKLQKKKLKKIPRLKNSIPLNNQV